MPVQRSFPLPWLVAGEPFPLAERTLGADSQTPGLLAAGGALDVDTLSRAYGGGIFPWFSRGQPILWWSPDPRMVLKVADFRVHASFAKTLRKFRKSAHCQIRLDTAFEQVIVSCANSARTAQAGTWIGSEMIAAYIGLHRAGLCHSMETWIDGELAGGLYFVALGKAVFGESMFSNRSDASKIALAALVCFCRQHKIAQIDCQQNTAHLGSLGAKEVPRDVFLASVRRDLAHPSPPWQFEAAYWQLLAPTSESLAALSFR